MRSQPHTNPDHREYTKELTTLIGRKSSSMNTILFSPVKQPTTNNRDSLQTLLVILNYENLGPAGYEIHNQPW